MFINGTNRLVYIKWDNNYLPIGCISSDSFDENIEMLGTTTRDNNGWKTDVPTNQSYNINIDGIVLRTLYDGQNDNFITLERLTDLKRNRTLIEWKIESSMDINISEGNGYITNISSSSNVDEFITFNANIQGYGGITDSKKELVCLQSSLQTNL